MSPPARPSLLARLRASRSTAPIEPVAVAPAAEPYDADARPDGPFATSPGGDGGVGVLLCHGFTGSPVSLRSWADHLHGAGLAVSLPRLPGHGTTWQELNLTRWPDWYAAVDHALTDLRRRCATTYVAGLSMGGALALRLAEQRPDDVAGLILVNPSVGTADPAFTYVLPWLRWLAPSVKPIANDIAKPGVDESGYPRAPLQAAYSLTRLWAQVRADLHRVRCPLLLYRSDVDHVVDPTSARLILAQVGSSIVLQRRLKRSWHVATMDWDAEEIFTGSVEFITRLQQRARSEAAVAEPVR